MNSDVTFKDILLHSPYEILLSYGLKESQFREYLLVRHDEYENIAKEIYNSFEINDKNKTFYFLKGFSGCGKTTFIRWFLKEHIDVEASPFNEKKMLIYREYINFSFQTHSNKRYFEDRIVEIISEKFDEYKPTFIFIEANFDTISSFLPGIKQKRKYVADITTGGPKTRLFEEAFHSLFDDLPIRTLLTICLLQKIITVINQKKDLCFFCIDNLDSLDYNYLLEDFWQDFFYAYNKLVDIHKEFAWTFDVKKKLKVLFILREHNYFLIRANFNKHANDILRPLTHDVFSILQPNLKKILENRVSYAMSKKIDIDSNILKLINIILEEDERYRDKFYLPLFNYDLRKLNQKIIEIASNEKLTHFVFDFDKYNYLYKNKDMQFKNGARGIIIHGFLKTLFDPSEKYPIDPLFEDDFSDEISGKAFCSHCRLLVTLIYNLTCYEEKRLNRNLDNLALITKEQFPLSRLISNLRIYHDPNNFIIPIKTVFYWLNKFYNIRNETITHLINISGKMTNSKSDISFESEIEESLLNNDLNNAKLNNIFLRINPSGVIYLRYLIPHFEFIAAYKYWREDKNSFIRDFKPLYLSTEYNAEDKKYEFETLIEDVYSFVAKKKKGNDKFLEEAILNKSKLDSINKYLDSRFVLHFKDSSSSQLYSSRVISTHLRYLDSFRKFLLDNEDFNNEAHRNSKKYGLSAKSIHEISFFILRFQKKYVNLYFENGKNLSFDNTISEKMKQWKSHIDDLLNGKESTWVTPDES